MDELTEWFGEDLEDAREVMAFIREEREEEARHLEAIQEDPEG